MRRLTVILLLMLGLKIWAQEVVPYVEMDKGTKKIYVQAMGLAPSTTLYEVLQLFPELLGREMSSMLSSYSVSLDDQNVGSGKISLLQQLTVSDVKCIEVNDNASATYATNGATGSINIVSSDLAAGVSGYALCEATTLASTSIAGAIGYRTDRLSLRANINGNYMRMDESYQVDLRYDDNLFTRDDYYDRQKRWNEGVKLQLDYRPTASDLLTARLWQSYSWENNYIEDEQHRYPWLSMSGGASFVQRETNSTLGQLTLFAQAKYEHQFGQDHKLGLMLNYNYGGQRTFDNQFVYRDGMDSTFYDQTNRRVPHQGNADLYYQGVLMNRDKHKMDLKVGLFANYASTRLTMIDSTYNTGTPTSDTLYSRSSNAAVSPYMEYNYAFGKLLTLNLGGRYRYEQIGQQDGRRAYHNYMLNLFLTIAPAEGHTLRLGALRNYLSPTFEAEVGHSYTAHLKYIYIGRFGEHHLNTETGLQYTRVHEQTSGDRYDVWQAHLSALWSYRWVSLALAFNLFDNQQLHSDQSLDYKGYYNLRFTPIFRLPADWQLSGTLMYNSSQVTQNLTIARYVYTALRVEKMLGKWSLYAEMMDFVHQATTDVNRYEQAGSKVEVLTTSHPYQRVFRLGAQYRF